MSCLRDRDFGELVSLWPSSGRGGDLADLLVVAVPARDVAPRSHLAFPCLDVPICRMGVIPPTSQGVVKTPKDSGPSLYPESGPPGTLFPEASGSLGWMDCPCLVYTKEVHGFAGDAESLAVRGAGSERFCAGSPGPISIGLQKVEDRELVWDCSVLSWPWLTL